MTHIPRDHLTIEVTVRDSTFWRWVFQKAITRSLCCFVSSAAFRSYQRFFSCSALSWSSWPPLRYLPAHVTVHVKFTHSQHYLWAFGHLVLLVGSLRYLLASLSFKAVSTWWYKSTKICHKHWQSLTKNTVSFSGALVSYAIVCQWVSVSQLNCVIKC